MSIIYVHHAWDKLKKINGLFFNAFCCPSAAGSIEKQVVDFSTDLKQTYCSSTAGTKRHATFEDLKLTQ
jgi:hypothetical protein